MATSLVKSSSIQQLGGENEPFIDGRESNLRVAS